MAVTPSSVQPGSIGRYRVLELLGRGAMGVVYKAHDPDIDRIVAIKLLRSDLLDGEDRAHHVARFRNEARMVGRCIHPNIVGIHDVSIHEGAPFLVLEYVDGKDLGQIYGRGVRVELATAARITLHVLEALNFAHGFGVIHRDIKPANIMLTANADLKVADFGISVALESGVTRSSMLVGTPCYMSPEQCLGGAIDARSDLFSLGCVFYELLSGARCFAAANYVATTHRILHEAPPSLRALCPDLPDAIVELVEKTLAKRPDDRFAGAAAMAGALRAALQATRPEAAEDPDATLIAPPPARAAAAPPLPAELDALAPDSLATIERRLAHHVGPMARYHLRRALREVRTPEELGRRLADLVPEGDDREAIQRGILEVIAADEGLVALRSRASTPTGVPPATIEAMTRALTQIMGPIATHLLRRALPTAGTPEQLEAACLAMVGRPDERERLRGLLAAWKTGGA